MPVIALATILGEIQRNDGTQENIKSPVIGVIEEVNETIDHDRLHSKLQVALRMKPFPVATATPPAVGAPTAS